MNTSRVSSPLGNRTGLLIFSIIIACAVSQASAQQSLPKLSRSGGQAPITAAAAQTPALPTQNPSSPPYTFTFGLIDYPRSQMGAAYGINDLGRIVGGYNNTSLDDVLADHGFEVKGNNFSTINYPGASQTDVFGINKSGEIVGTFATTATGCCRGFKLVNGVYTELIYPGSKNSDTFATGVNSTGQIVGDYADPTTGNSVGYLLSGGVYTSISVPGATWTYLDGINKAGVIAGYYEDTSGNWHGFTWTNGTTATLDYGNGYPNTYLAGINDNEVIVGGYGTNVTIGSQVYPWEHGFLYSNGTFSTFDAPFGNVQVTQPWGMNNNNEIVGGYVDSQGMLYGFYLKAQ